MNPINIGVIGCGRIADLHLPGYQGLDRAGIYAVCDVRKETAERRREQWGAEKAYTDYRDLIRDPAVDAVEILTPHQLHEAMAIEALRAGKHVALQKPMTTSLASADRILEAASRAGVVFKVTDNYLFYPPIVLARKMIGNGDIGEPTNIRIKMIAGGSGGWEVPASAWEWRLKENAEGRGLQTFDHGHHLWTTAWFLLGRVERVAAWIDTLDGLVDSPAVVIWKYRDGVRYGMCEYAYAPDLHVPSRYYANDEWIEITGSRGLIVIHRCTGHILDGPALSWFDGNRWTGSDDLACDWSEGFKGATRNFVAAIRGEEPPLLDGEQAREVLRLSLAISKASRVRREVYLDEFAARIPWLYTRARIHLDKKRRSGAGGLWARLGLGGRESGFAPQADTLTRGLMDRLRTEALEGWEAEIGLHLLAQGGVPESEWSLSVRGGRADLSPGRLPERPDLVLRVPAGTWAAVLSGHKRIEVALLQGRLKLEGRAELGLKLRSAFGL